MPCTEPQDEAGGASAGVAPTGAAAPVQTTEALRWPAGSAAWLRTVTVASVLAGCSSPIPPHAPAIPQRPTQTPAPPMPGKTGDAGLPTAGAAPTDSVSLKPPGPVRNWDEVRRQAAERMVAANPKTTYTGTVPDNLLAIPVLEIELHADGSIRRIDVLRHPRQAKDTTQLAIDAVHRAAPFGQVGRLPRPWKFTETFLFDDDRRFKPRTLD